MILMEGGVWKATTVEISPNCPRCGSSNTKFCYYNNYSLTQPRYFCKGCRRYWTKGGSLRNVPVGGGCRKNRRAKSFKILTDRLPSKGLACSDPNLPHDPDSITSSGLHDASPSSSPSSPSIDLALVYAHFVNKKPEPKCDGFEVVELPYEFHPSFQLSSALSSSTTNMDSSQVQLQDLREENQVYLTGFHSIPAHYNDHDTPNFYGLPPLPGQELASQENLWPISRVMVQNQSLHEAQLQDLHPEAAQDPNLSVSAGAWSSFDLPCYGTFSRP